MRLCKALNVLLISLVSFIAPGWSDAGQVDWPRIKSVETALFYPGVSSWDFLTSDDHRLGAREIKKGKKDCRHCHLDKSGSLDLKADDIASGSMKMKRSHKPFEPEPLAGRKGVMLAGVQAAYDAENLYLRFNWLSKGSGWNNKGRTPDRISIQVNKTEPSFSKYGCFITCHKDLSTMPDAPSKREIEGNPAYSGRDEVSLYAFYARSSWADKRADADAKFRDGLIDLKAIEFEGGRVKSEDGWVFDTRAWEDKPGFEGTGSWAGGRYTAVFRIKRAASGKYNIGINEGDIITLGVAIHEDGASKRKHYVSLPIAIGIGIGQGGDIKAVKVQN